MKIIKTFISFVNKLQLIQFHIVSSSDNLVNGLNQDQKLNQ